MTEKKEGKNKPTEHTYVYKCPHCGGFFHRIAKHATPLDVARGDMFVLLDYYRKLGWESFEETEHTRPENILCPECGMQYCDTITGKMKMESIKQED